MSTLTSIGICRNQIETTVRNIVGLVSASSLDSNSFQDCEKTLLTILNELGRQALAMQA